MKKLQLKSPVMQATLVLLIVFLIDIFTPLGITIGILYLFSFFLICRQNKKTIIAFAVITPLLTIAKLIIFFSPTINYMAFLNRVITIIVLIIIAVLALRHRELVETINRERNSYIKKLEEMLFMTSHRVRKPVSTCLGLMHFVETDCQLTVEERHKVVKHLKENVLEIDTFTKELTTFMNDIKIKNQIRNRTNEACRQCGE